MRLLIITQKVDKNDSILGFFHRWIEEFAKNVDKLTVICLEKGEYNLPENVKVLSLGKDEGVLKITYIIRFYQYIYSERKSYYNVFVHMNPIYIVLGGLLWKSWNKKIGLWYTHKSVDLKLRVSEKITNFIFTASKESFRLPSAKLNILGHGIDVNNIEPTEHRLQKGDTIKIVHVGRISKTKNIHLILEAIQILHEEKIPFLLTLVGGSVTAADKKYEETLHSYVKKFGLGEYVVFAGATPHTEIFNIYKQNDVAINLSDTGSLDKSVLEAIASGLQVLVSNEAFENLPNENKTTKDPEQIAKDIQGISQLKSNEVLKKYVAKEHNLSFLIPQIINIYK